MSITVKEIYDYLDQWAPFDQAEAWDNSGIQIGNLRTTVNSVLLTLDVSRTALQVAQKNECELIISHHPLIFTPLDSVLEYRPGEKLVYELIQNNISLIAAHTNLDAAPGGVADALAQVVLEAIDVPELTYVNLSRYGRCMLMRERLKLDNLSSRIRRVFGAGCRINLPTHIGVRNIALYPGSLPQEEIGVVLGADIDLVICGEVKHHLNVLLADNDVAVMDIGHGQSEQPVLEPLAERLHSQFSQVKFAVHQAIDYNVTAY